ncbi:hypothetical protein XA68_15436 [Ophiocordyceps unilateralis]|uniref:Putative ER transporter 6TM N-terminal domain-containing protein n=1 Tax=Ophiocordyceps unilateralis TaxID=268505 RepID=A0A2A9P8G4_OPHUN|nr:hypothetical protein XA68_15436 [Ophiocordyceps unilateralis]
MPHQPPDVRRRRQRHVDMRPTLDPDAFLEPVSPPPTSRRSSTHSLAQLDHMVSDKIDTETYGVSELRDGFFDAMFLRPSPSFAADLLQDSADTLPAGFEKASPLTLRCFFPRQWRALVSVVKRVTTTRAGIRLLKSLVAFFVAYVLCLVPVIRDWLGRYYYFTAVSVIVNHPARSLGSQLDGAALTVVGAACGLGWGALGLLLSKSTLAARAGYGGVLAVWMALFMTSISLTRAFFIRFYQAILAAGLAVIFATLAETGSRQVDWAKLRDYGFSWLFGQAIAMVINCVVFPDAGARDLATTFHAAFDVMLETLDASICRDRRLRRRLTRTFVDLSQACRDMKIDITVTRFRPDDVGDLRNLMQAVIRALLTLKADTYLFKHSPSEIDVTITVDEPILDVTTGTAAASPGHRNLSRRAIEELGDQTKHMLSCMSECVRSCDAALMDLSGHRRNLGPAPDVSSDVLPAHRKLRRAKAAYDVVEASLIESEEHLAESSIQDGDVVQLFVFARHVREAASAMEQLVDKVQAMRLALGWPRPHLPSYPFWKALHRTNAQTRHDRGGVTAGSYHVTFEEIGRLLDKMKSSDHEPVSREEVGDGPGICLETLDSHTSLDAGVGPSSTAKTSRLRYRIWRVLKRLQGFESRYAFKVCLVTTLLSIPAYLDRDRGWWEKYECWWAVSISWLAMHPRVGGNVQDLFIRALMAVLGAAWSAAAYAAGNGNPYVMAAFAAVYMTPMLFRFTQSSHPRSGLIGCLSFTVISLRLQVESEGTSPTLLAVYSGVAFLIGATVPIVVNWVLWPFVARHELRRALSSMMFFMSVIYRSVVARYVYFYEGKEPTPEDVQRSEMLEGRLREGFVRIRQLLVLTQKEIRLRAPFDPLPYSALADSCERFFDYLVAVRQSALFYNPDYIRDNPQAAEQLLSYRRDAVAAILGNLYILAGALRSKRKVPRYLPNAAAARRRLLIKNAEVDEEMSRRAGASDAEWHKRWSDIYRYSYNESLVGCVAQLEELEKLTKLIVGEQ